MEIDWKKLRQANGPATKVPQQVKALTANRGARESEREENRWNTYVMLNEALAKNRQWFTASLPAAQLLVEQTKKIRPGFVLVLRLLTDLMCGDHLIWLSKLPGAANASDPIERDIRALAGTIGADARVLLENDDPKIREGAAMFLGCLLEQAQDSLPALKARLAKETDPKALGSALMAIAVLSRHQGVVPEELRGFTGAGREPLVRGLAAIGLMMNGIDRPRAISKILWEFLVNSDGGGWSYGGGWNSGNPDHLLIAVSQSMGPAFVDEAVDALVDELSLMGKGTVDGSERVSSVILTLTGFKERWPDHHALALPEELSPRQWQLAERLANCSTPYGFGYGLPQVTRFIDRWLGKKPPTLFEERIDVTVDGVKVSRPRWWAWMHRDKSGVDAKGIDSFIAALDIPTRVWLIGEIWSDGYWMNLDADSASVLRLPELLRLLPEGDPTWAADYADELLKEPCDDTPAGPIGRTLFMVKYALFMVLVRSRVPLKKEWIALVPRCAARSMTLRELFEQLPYEFREDGAYRLLYAFTSSALEELIPVLDLFASRRVIEKLLEMEQSPESWNAVSDEYLPDLLAKYDEIAKTHPEFNEWIKEWKAAHPEKG
jgi:hypothetical protein